MSNQVDWFKYDNGRSKYSYEKEGGSELWCKYENASKWERVNPAYYSMDYRVVYHPKEEHVEDRFRHPEAEPTATPGHDEIK